MMAPQGQPRGKLTVTQYFEWCVAAHSDKLGVRPVALAKRLRQYFPFVIFVSQLTASGLTCGFITEARSARSISSKLLLATFLLVSSPSYFSRFLFVSQFLLNFSSLTFICCRTLSPSYFLSFAHLFQTSHLGWLFPSLDYFFRAIIPPLSLSLALSPRETSAIKRHFSYAAYIEQSPFFFLLLLYGKVFLRSVRIYFVELRKYSPEKSEHIVAHGISNPSNPFSVSSPFVSPFCSSTVSSFNVSAYISTPPVQIFRWISWQSPESPRGAHDIPFGGPGIRYTREIRPSKYSARRSKSLFVKMHFSVLRNATLFLVVIGG